MQEKLDRLNTSIQESMTNVRLIKSFVREDFERNVLENQMRILWIHPLASKVMILTMPLMTLCMNFATVLVVWFGGRMVMKTDMSVGHIVCVLRHILYRFYVILCFCQ